jgi:hypothetical protein
MVEIRARMPPFASVGRSHHAPAEAKRVVRQGDNRQCTFVGAGGRAL